MKMKTLIVALITLLLALPAVISVKGPVVGDTPEKPKYDPRMAMFTWGCSDIACKETPGWQYKITNRAEYLTQYHITMVRGKNWGRYVYAPNTMVRNRPGLTPREQWILENRQRFVKQ